MFEGSEHYPGDFFKPLQRLGAAVNGSTSSDRTNYFVDLPTAHRPLALAMESDRMGHFLPTPSPTRSSASRRTWSRTSTARIHANRPYGQAWRILSRGRSHPPDHHPYSWLTIGLMEDVSRRRPGATSRRSSAGFYVPSNASLALVGDIDESEAVDLAARYFGDIPGGSKAIRPRTPSLDRPTRWGEPL